MTTIVQQQDHQKIIEYYEEAGMDYRAWSRDFNMHFGYFKWGLNPFRLEPMLNQMNKEIYQRLHLETIPLPMILDAGCGLGTSSRYMAKKRPDACFYNVTITPWQIQKGEKMNKKAGLGEQISMLLADFQKLPLADESFDASFALESSCYADGMDKKRFITEMHRVLRPNGRLVVADGFLKKNKPLPYPIRWIYEKCTTNWALDDFANLNAFVNAMKEVGFKNISIEDVSWNIAPSVLHIPKTAIKFYLDLLRSGESWKLSKERRGNVLAPLFGMLLGLARPYFGYFIISAEK